MKLRPFRIFLLLSFLALAIAPARLALAQEELSPTDAEARALFEAGQIAFNDGRYDAALEYFQRSYALSHRPGLLFNIGSTAQVLRRDQDALDAYVRYLSEFPDAPNRNAVESRIEVLREAIRNAGTTSSSSSAPAPTSSTGGAAQGSSSSDPGAVPYVVIAIGGALAVAGAVLLGVGAADSGTVSNAADGVTWPELEGAYSRAPILQGVGGAALGLGVAAAAAGIGWALSGGGSSAEAGASAWVDEDAAGIFAWGTF